MKFKKYDIIYFDFEPSTEREIVEAFETYYFWRYVGGLTVYDSRVSNDPKLKHWTIKE